MRKRISLKTRRPDLSRREFRDYYENNHVPLGLSFIEHFGWRRYVRNHILATDGALVSFDCYTEFWVDDDSDDEALYRFLRSPDFRRLDQDDRRFLDISRRMSFEVREATLKNFPAAATGSSAGPTHKVVLIWRQGSNPRGDAGTLANRIVQFLGARVRAAVLDSAIQPLQPDAPFDTLLSLYLEDDRALELDPGLLPEARWSLLWVDPVETPPEQLSGGGAGGTQHSGAASG